MSDLLMNDLKTLQQGHRVDHDLLIRDLLIRDRLIHDRLIHDLQYLRHDDHHALHDVHRVRHSNDGGIHENLPYVAALNESLCER
jgi:hypothetical protein